MFFKDGFTDFLGNFKYAHASGSAQKNLFDKFAIFISHPDHGSVVKYADAKKLDPLSYGKSNEWENDWKLLFIDIWMQMNAIYYKSN